MPLYDYQCEGCKNKFEQSRALKEYDYLPLCPKCNSSMTKKLMTLGGIQDQHPVWLDNSIRNQIQDLESERPIETRKEYNNYLKDNGIIPTN